MERRKTMSARQLNIAVRDAGGMGAVSSIMTLP